MLVSQEEKDRGCDTEHQQSADSIIEDLHTRKNAEYELINHDDNELINHAELKNHDDSYSAGSLGNCSSLDEANSKKLLDKTRKSCAEDGKEKESSSKEDVANADYEGVDKGLVDENKSGTEDGNEMVTSPSDEGNDSSSESSDEDNDSSSESSDEDNYEGVDKGLVNGNKSGTEDGNERVTSPSDEGNVSSSELSDEDKATDVGSSVSEKVEVVSYFCLSTSYA